MNFTKNIFKSKTIWGALVAIGGSVLGLGSQDVSEVTNYTSQAVDAIGQLITIGGALFAIWGRYHATKELTVVPEKK